MTDDTDHDDHGDDAVSLPLIDSFAALEAEIDAKADRIERLEAELDRRYLDPDGEATDPDGADESGETDPRSPGDWEPATDPLRDAGAATPDGDRDGVTPSLESTATVDDSGLAPVRTASSGNRTPQKNREPTAREPAAENDEPSGVTMEAGSDLTGGSLGSTTDARSARVETAERGEATGGTAESGADRDDSATGTALPDPTADRGERLSRLVRRAERRDEEEVIDAFVDGIEALDGVTRAMLAHYREAGDAAPVDAHVAAGGSGERQYAYARNRTLRKAGVIEHEGAGRYRYALPDLVAEAFDGNADGRTVGDAVDAIEAAADLE
ncbi:MULTISPECIES: hypothetical protein [Halolamina]|uniref:Winged helix domain-containing protein n=1 Tax=Halolamina pelagica TaxID=699431 RepID=A0A1I5P565_9EURY|nr:MULTISPECIES: hypothetical protein [Halolamina]NHX36639.1 hypothetical protein [Halolamina sp. R1-12]SFP29239.1 hypothetical protein SAMN05216277_102361 [Halolamina pelagica]